MDIDAFYKALQCGVSNYVFDYGFVIQVLYPLDDGKFMCDVNFKCQYSEGFLK